MTTPTPAPEFTSELLGFVTCLCTERHQAVATITRPLDQVQADPSTGKQLADLVAGDPVFYQVDATGLAWDQALLTAPISYPGPDSDGADEPVTVYLTVGDNDATFALHQRRAYQEGTGPGGACQAAHAADTAALQAAAGGAPVPFTVTVPSDDGTTTLSLVATPAGQIVPDPAGS